MNPVQQIITRYHVHRRRRAFTSIYERHGWTGSDSRSGQGSSLDFTAPLRTSLPRLLGELGVKTLLDAPCGDFFWMKEVPLELDRYYGVDIVRALIENNRTLYGGDGREFLACDVVRDSLPAVELILCRHLLIHLSFEECWQVLRNFQVSGARYLLISDQPAIVENHEILKTGSFRPLNLRLPPFSLPAPLLALNDSADRGGSAILALYPLQQLSFGNT